MPAIEIETVPAAVYDVDGSLLDQIGLFNRVPHGSARAQEGR
jgi:hypothetical protein